MKNILGVDHIGWLVRDLDRSEYCFRRLGFTLSPRQFHSANMGSANHTFVLEDGYVEFIGFTSPTAFNESWQRKVRKREGVYIVSARTTNVAMALQELRAAGVSASDVVAHSRPATLPDGSTVTVAFDVVYVDDAASAPMHVSVCQHHNPEHIFIEALSHHPNTALALRTVFVATDDVPAAARRCATLFGAEPVQHGPTLRVDAGGTMMEFAERSAYAKFLGESSASATAHGADSAPVGVSFEVASLRAASDCLRKNGLAYAESAAVVTVAPPDGVGAFIQFRER